MDALVANDPSLSLVGAASVFVDSRNGATFALAGPMAFRNYFMSDYERRFVRGPANACDPMVRELFERWRAEAGRQTDG
ncbi:MAG: hypothetical protein ACRELY_30015 [Polyangiaceae bacterium]